MEAVDPSEEEEEHPSETGEPEAPPPVLLRQCTVLISQEGGPSLTDDDFPVGCFEIPATDSTDPATVAIVLVAELDHRLVACIPFQCWHRVLNKRVLPPKALIKPLVLELPFVDRADAEAAVSHQKCWLGVLAPEFEDYVVFEASLDLADVDYKFLPGAPYCAPLAASLVEAFERHFGFVSATSGGGVGGAVPSKSTAAPLPGSTLDTRLQALENSVAAIAESLKQQTGAPSRPSALKKPVEPCPPPGLALPTKSGGLDADVLRAAQLAGIPEDHIMQMSQLIARGKPKLSDLPAQRARKTTSGPLSESEDSSGEEEGDAEQSAGAQTESKTLAAAVSKLTKIAGHLTEQRTKSKSLEALLDGVGSGNTETAGLGGTRKYAAALRALRKAVPSQPAEISKILEGNMRNDFNLQGQVPGSAAVQLTARAWLEMRSKVQNFQTPVRLLWGIAGALDCLIQQRPEEARARLGLLLAMGDQLSIDRGSWLLAAEISLEDPPPLSSFSHHVLPQDNEAPYTKLVDGRWIDLFLQKLNDYENLADKKRKLAARKNIPPNPDPPVKPPKKGNGKGKTKQEGSGGAEGGDVPH